MRLEKIITLASAPVRLRFLAMERSLRAQGCDLPVWVIPYGEDRLFELPPGCHWWRQPETLAWLDGESAHPTARKYQCFLEANYQFVDADVIFLRDPAAALAPHAGFVMSCGHWRDSDHTITAESLAIFRDRSTTWQRWIFNSGQFASDTPLFPDLAALRRVASAPEHVHTCLRLPYEQPGVNLLALLSGVPMQHLTLPPVAMESTWAGDYDDADFRRFWRDERNRPLSAPLGRRGDAPAPADPRAFLRVSDPGRTGGMARADGGAGRPQPQSRQPAAHGKTAREGRVAGVARAMNATVFSLAR